MEIERACCGCFFHRPTGIIGQVGKCVWVPPPALARLYAALHQEPMTRIDYTEVFSEPPDAMHAGSCGAWSRKLDA